MGRKANSAADVMENMPHNGGVIQGEPEIICMVIKPVNIMLFCIG